MQKVRSALISFCLILSLVLGSVLGANASTRPCGSLKDATLTNGMFGVDFGCSESVIWQTYINGYMYQYGSGTFAVVEFGSGVKTISVKIWPNTRYEKVRTWHRGQIKRLPPRNS